ncbi:electron transfer flavoprotein alpha/beta subunit [Microbacter margulisiae]|uniref:Electron transfer flavoprotein alpha/beta subunit n=1 Tax=Microbacter margulisiae TaxID=1350067 RepID=A0A7W5DP65_9PORP|nr:electron transfer flavoprotein alpha/beta subunit [Microbacter margulisiae]
MATSYALACAVRNLPQVDVIVCGRQAIDGDTAQVGPQVAEKLGLPQITYAEEITDVTDGVITVKRRLDHGVETVKGKLPLLVTVNGSAAPCRPRHAKLVMKYHHAKTITEKQERDDDYMFMFNARPYLNITEWSVNDIKTDMNWLGLKGSPTKVKAIENVVFQAKESKQLVGTDNEIDELMKELIANHTIG